MKGEIDKYGCLRIERCGKLSLQFCCYNKPTACSDECVLFGEPVKVYKEKATWGSNKTKMKKLVKELKKNPNIINLEVDEAENTVNIVYEELAWTEIQLCKKTICFDELIDHREELYLEIEEATKK